MAISHDLTLPQEVLLLALHDEKGTIHSGTTYQYALGGAILAELLLTQRVRLVQERKKQLIEPVGASPLGDDVADEALSKVRKAKRRASPKTWVTRFSSMKSLKHRIARGLCRRGVLREDEHSVLLFFSRRVYPTRDARPEKQIVERIRNAVISGGDQIEPRLAVLIALSDTAGLMKTVLDKRERKAHRERIKEISSGNAIGVATREAIEAVQAAMAAAAAATVVVNN